MSWVKKHWQWMALVLALVAISIAATFLPLGSWLRGFTGWVRHLGVIGGFLFIGLYALAAVCLLPGALFTIAAGLVYGIAWGTAVALTGATLGACLAFLLARYLLREKVESYAKNNPKFRAIDREIGSQGWKIVGLLRLSPLIPFNVSNYFYGVTSIGFLPYFLATAIGMLPGTLLYAYLGAIGQAGLAGGKHGHTPLEWTFLGLGLAATIGVTVFVSHLAKRALQQKGAAGSK